MNRNLHCDSDHIKLEMVEVKDSVASEKAKKWSDGRFVIILYTETSCDRIVEGG